MEQAVSRARKDDHRHFLRMIQVTSGMDGHKWNYCLGQGKRTSAVRVDDLKPYTLWTSCIDIETQALVPSFVATNTAYDMQAKTQHPEMQMEERVQSATYSVVVIIDRSYQRPRMKDHPLGPSRLWRPLLARLRPPSLRPLRRWNFRTHSTVIRR